MDSRIRPNASDWPAAANGWRSSWPRPRRQGREARASRRRRLCNSSRSKPPRTNAATHAAAEQGEGQHQVEAQAPHDQAQGEAAPRRRPSRCWTGSAAGRGAAPAAAGPGPAPPDGGRAKPARATSPVPIPATAGSRPAGRHVRRQQVVQQVEQAQLRQPAQQGAGQAGRAARARLSCRLNSSMASRRDKPRQRSSALASKRRLAKRLADSATATPASSTATRLAMFR